MVSEGNSGGDGADVPVVVAVLGAFSWVQCGVWNCFSDGLDLVGCCL